MRGWKVDYCKSRAMNKNTIISVVGFISICFIYVFVSPTHRALFCLELLGPLILDSHTLPGGTRSPVNTPEASTPAGSAPPPQRVTGNRRVVHICFDFQELHVCHILLRVYIFFNNVNVFPNNLWLYNITIDHISTRLAELSIQRDLMYYYKKLRLIKNKH